MMDAKCQVENGLNLVDMTLCCPLRHWHLSFTKLMNTMNLSTYEIKLIVKFDSTETSFGSLTAGWCLPGLHRLNFRDGLPRNLGGFVHI